MNQRRMCCDSEHGATSNMLTIETEPRAKARAVGRSSRAPTVSLLSPPPFCIQQTSMGTLQLLNTPSPVSPGFAENFSKKKKSFGESAMCGNDRPRELFATATGLAVTRVPDVARQCCVLRVCTFCQFCLLQPLTLRRCVLYCSKNSSSTSTKGGKRAARYMAHKQAIPDGKIKQASLLNPSTSQQAK